MTVNPAPSSVGRNTLLAFVAQVGGAAFTGFLTIFLARKLGTHGYGTFSLALGITGLWILPADFGISNSVARFVAEHLADHARLEVILGDGLRLKLIASSVISVALVALAGPIASAYGIPALAWPLRGAAIALFGQSVMMITAVFTALGRLDLTVKTVLYESLVETTATVALVLLGAGAAGAAFGQAIGYSIGAGMTLGLVTRTVGRRVLPRSLRFGPHARTIAGYAGVLLIVDSAYTAFSQVDVLVIGAFAGARAVGIFSGPARLIKLISYPGSALSAGIAPRLSSGSGEPDVAAFMTGLRILLIIQGAITAFVLGWAALIIRISLGPGFGASASVLRAMAPYAFLSGFGTLVSIAANYVGLAGRRVPIAIVTVLVNIILDFVLVPELGAMGGAIGTDIAFTIYAPAHLLICRRALGLSLRPLALTAVRVAIAAAALTGSLLAFGDSVDRLGVTLTGGLLGAAAFAIVLLVTGEVSRDDLVTLTGGRLSARS